MVFATLAYVAFVCSNEHLFKEPWIDSPPPEVLEQFDLQHFSKSVHLGLAHYFFTSLQLFPPKYALHKDSQASHFSEPNSKLASQVPK